MDFISALLDFLNLTDNTHYVRKAYEKLTDKNEYLGERILSFLSLLITLIAFLFLIYIIYIIIKKQT
jgi:hypothetical protein